MYLYATVFSSDEKNKTTEQPCLKKTPLTDGTFNTQPHTRKQHSHMLLQGFPLLTHLKRKVPPLLTSRIADFVL